jgi:hypothetical protein
MPDHQFWLRMQIEDMRSSIALMESGRMQIRILHGSEWIEYVAPRVMLRPRDLALSHRRSTASTQHNVSAPREVA